MLRRLSLLAVGILMVALAGCSGEAPKTEATTTPEASVPTGRSEQAQSAEMMPGPGNATVESRIGSMTKDAKTSQ